MSDPGLGPRPTGDDVVAERSITTSVEQAYRAWSEEAEFARWFAPISPMDVRVGGRYGGEGTGGEYLEVVPNERLRFTWEQSNAAPGSQVIVEFTGDGDDVATVRITHKGAGSEHAVDLQNGWEWGLDSLKSYLETGQPVDYADWASRREMGH